MLVRYLVLLFFAKVCQAVLWVVGVCCLWFIVVCGVMLLCASVCCCCCAEFVMRVCVLCAVCVVM